MVTVTRLTIENLESASRLFSQYRQFYGQADDQDRCDEFLSQRVSNQESVIFVAAIDEVEVGFVQLYPSYSSISLKRVWILNDLFVAEEHRCQGVGRMLLQEAQQFAKESNAARLLLCTGTENEHAQRLYESAGWQRHSDYIYYIYTLE